MNLLTTGAVQGVEDKVSELKRQLQAAQEEQARLAGQAATTQQRLWRAAKLTSSLNEEGLRWKERDLGLQVMSCGGHIAHLHTMHEHCICATSLLHTGI